MCDRLTVVGEVRGRHARRSERCGKHGGDGNDLLGKHDDVVPLLDAIVDEVVGALCSCVWEAVDVDASSSTGKRPALYIVAVKTLGFVFRALP